MKKANKEQKASIKLEIELLSDPNLIPMQLIKSKVRAVGPLVKHH